MPDQVSSLRIAVKIDGLADLNRLSNTFAQLRAEATARPAAVRAATARRPQQQTQQVQSMGERLGEQVGEQVIAPTLKAPFAVVRSAATLATRSVISIVGPMGKLATAGVAGTATLGAAALAVVAVGVPLFNLAATMRILRTSFGWAKEAADRQLTVLARTKKTFPGLTGDALRAAETRTGAKLRLASALFGEGAEALAEQITRRFTEVRMGKGLRGERDIFLRWGITPAAVQTFERARGGERIDLTDWLALFIKKREDLDRRQAATKEGSAEWRGIAARRALLYDDSLKLFGQKFSDILGTWSSFDLARLRQNLQKATPLGAAGPGVDADQRARDFNIQLATTQTIFAQLKKGIAGDVMPTLTTMMDELRDWLTDTEEGGKGMGRAFRNLGSALAVNAWQTMQALVEGIDPNEVKKFTTEMQSWNPQETLTNLAAGVSALVKMVEVIAAITKLLTGAWGPQWLRRRVRGGGYRGERRPGPGEPGGGAPVTGATFAERWAGAPGGGGGGYMGGGGPGYGSAGGGLTRQQETAQRALAAAPEGRVPRYGTPQHQQWAQTPEYQQWAQESPEFQQWQRQERAKGPTARLGPARFIRPGYAPPAPEAPPAAAPGGPGVQTGAGMPQGVTQSQFVAASQAALGSGMQGVRRYFQSQGMSMPTQWCGAFAATVLKQHNIKPPKDYQAAGAWRNFGMEVNTRGKGGAPQPGDIVVVSGRSRFTGLEGRHVTFVERYDPKTGMVYTIGGNEGYERGNRQPRHISGLYIRRVPQAVAGAPEGTAQAEAANPPTPPPPTAVAPGPTAPAPTGPAPTTPAPPPPTTTQAYGPSRHRGLAALEPYIQKAARASGLSALHIRTMILIESNANPNQKTGSYKGLLQLDDAQFRKHGGRGSIYDPEQNIMAGAGKIKEAQGQFRTNLAKAGITGPVEPWQYYMAHQQGAWGAAAHHATPDQPAWRSFQRASKWQDWKAQKAIYGNLTASAKAKFKAKYGNNWHLYVTSREFMAEWKDRYAKKELEAGGTGSTLAASEEPKPTTATGEPAEPEPERKKGLGPGAAAAAAREKKEEAAKGASDKDKAKEPVKAAGSDEEKKDKDEDDDKKKKDLVKVELSDPILMPRDLLETAKKHALESGPEGVNKFLSKWGVSRAKLDQPWCGKFAAAVVREHGLEPPKQFETASAWRNWGEKVETPEPGDIAVQIGKRQEVGGGKNRVETLQPGSHVTIVETVDPKTGTMTTIGGNQALKPAQRYGKLAQTGRSKSPVGAFEYYRLPQQVAETVKEADPAFDSGTKALLNRREEQRKALIDQPIRTRSMRRRALEEGRAAGEAAADSFKRGIADTTIPIKSLREEDTQREQKREEREKEAA